MNIPKLIDDIVAWIKKYCDQNEIDSLIVGVSGGIDSSVVARLCEKTGIRTICVSMPYEFIPASPTFNGLYNAPADGTSTRRAYDLCRGRKVDYFVKTIREVVDAYQRHTDIGENKLLEGNLRSRIRANILYDFAGKYNGIVVGTGNKDEDQIGYATKGGDLLTDLNPLSNLHKSVVYKIAEEFDNIPQETIDTAPTAELWEGQTDEQELGMTYDEIECALKTLDDLNNGVQYLIPIGRVTEVLDKVAKMKKKNAHKLRYPPVFNPNNPERIE